MYILAAYLNICSTTQYYSRRYPHSHTMCLYSSCLTSFCVPPSAQCAC